MTDTLENTPKIPDKISRLDRNILSATKALDYPTKANISKHVVALGGAKHIQTVYKRLKQKDYLHADLQTIEDYNQQQLVREDYPLARKRLRNALKDKELSHKDALPYVKLAYDKTHGEKHMNAAAQTVNIVQIQQAAIGIGADISRITDQD